MEIKKPSNERKRKLCHESWILFAEKRNFPEIWKPLVSLFGKYLFPLQCFIQWL